MDWWKKKKKKSQAVAEQNLVRERLRGEILLEELIECFDGKSNPIKYFSADQIIKASNNVCKCNISQRSTKICQCTRISELSDHVRWYSGMLDNHRMILVNILVYGVPDYPRQFCHDIAISSMLSGHKNFMKLVGCCLEWPYPVMVYYGEKKQYSRIDLEMLVSWRRRMKMAEDIATALAYLHTAFPRVIIYANMNLRNIIMDDETGIAKLTDFSKCVSIPQGETFVKLDSVCGDYYYMDDDYKINHILSEKTDAYGCGIFMRKLLTGEESFHELYRCRHGLNKFPNQLSKSIGEGRMNEIVDPKMLENMNEVADEERYQMEAFLVLSERCIGLRGEVPKMVEVAKELKRFLKTTSSSETQIRL